MGRRKKGGYFRSDESAPKPVVVEVKGRVRFSDTDPMGIVWFGRYPAFFEDGSAELGRRCGLSYRDFYEAGLRAPVVECHIDYHASLVLDEEFTIRASLFWNEGARMDTEYMIIKGDGTLAATGYTVQLFTDENRAVCMVSPPLLQECRRRWKKGELY